MGLKKEIAITSASKAIGLVSGFVTTILAARYCSKEEFGIFILLTVVAMYAGAVFNFGIQVGALRTVSISPENNGPRIFGSLIVHGMATFLFSIVLVGCILPFVHRPGAHLSFTDFLWWTPFLFVTQNYIAYFSVMLQGMEKFTHFAIGNILLSVLNLLFLIGFVFWKHLDAPALIISTISSRVFVAALFSIWVLNSIKPDFTRIRTTLRELFTFSYPLGVNQLQTILFTRVDTLMISFFLGSEKVAVYEIARKIPLAINRLYEAVRIVLFPRLSKLWSKKDIDGSEKIVRTGVFLISGLLSILALNIFFFSDPIIPLLFTDRYLDACIPFAILSFSLCISLASNLMGTSLVAGRFREKPALINIVMTAANVVGNYLMIPVWGLFGAALATLISVVLTNPLNYYYVRKMGLKVNLSDYSVLPLTALVLVGAFTISPGASLPPTLKWTVANLAAAAVFMAMLITKKPDVFKTNEIPAPISGDARETGEKP